MSLPVEFNTVPVTGKYVLLNGTPVTGSVKFTGKIILTAADSDTMIIPIALSATLDGEGAFAINLPATDDPDISPSGWTYTVSETFTNGGGRTYDIDVPIAAAGTGIEISDVAPVSASDGDPTAFVTLSAYSAGIANKADLSGPVFTGPVAIRMGAGLSFLVQNADGSITYFSVGDGAVNFNVPFGAYFMDLTGQRLYQGDADPDPGAPNGSRWLSPTGLKVRTAGSWAAAESLNGLGVVNRALSSPSENATTTPQSIGGLSLGVDSTGTYRAEFELWMASTANPNTGATNIAWSLAGPTVSAVRTILSKTYLSQGPDAVFTPATDGVATSFGAIGNTWTSGSGMVAGQIWKQTVETRFVATATGTLALSFAPLGALTAPGAQVLAMSTSRLTKIA